MNLFGSFYSFLLFVTDRSTPPSASLHQTERPWERGGNEGRESSGSSGFWVKVEKGGVALRSVASGLYGLGVGVACGSKPITTRPARRSRPWSLTLNGCHGNHLHSSSGSLGRIFILKVCFIINNYSNEPRIFFLELLFWRIFFCMN